MTDVSPDAHATTPGPVSRDWLDVARAHVQANGWHPSRVVVLVPYAQMMDALRRRWMAASPSGFPPRFESTRNWAATLGPFVPGRTDISGDVARDSLIAGHWIDRVAGRTPDPELRATLVSRLVEAAHQLVPVAAAQPPERRMAWAETLRAGQMPASPTLQWESLVASLALTWAGVSAFATDVLWSDRAAPGSVADALLLVPGFQDDPLALALLAHWGARGHRLPLAEAPGPAASGHACGDAEDEAQRAAACVVAEVNAGHVPVALVAQDRIVTRRIGALLHGVGVSVRDETGWKLSTTHAATRLMGLLRASDRRARTDEVLDWLRWGPHAVAARVIERLAREHGWAAWRSVLTHPAAADQVPAAVREQLDALQASRPLLRWLQDLAVALQADGWWATHHDDAAGQRIIDVLRLREGAAHELDQLDGEPETRTGRPGARACSLSAFSAWVRDALEAASFQPPAPAEAQVVVLPMAQLLGRSFAAVVAPGCDEVSLPSSPEPTGAWSEAQRAQLGLPGREVLAEAAHAAWRNLLAQPRVHLLWRTEHQGDVVAAAPWVRSLHGTLSIGQDSRAQRILSIEQPPAPAPVASDLLPQALSASAYQDLRDCPYRFFALRQLRLQQVDEIEAEPDKRDLGNWLHAVLKAFHEARAAELADGLGDRERLDALAQAEARLRGLSPDSGEAGFLPFMAAWPALRDGYLAWLTGHEADGPVFERAEVSLSRTVGPWRLIGQLDRIDRQASPEGRIPLVIDYKTEPRSTTQERVKSPLEDTQIAFYAALLGEETVRGAYLSITDSRETTGKDPATRWVEQPELLVAREHLLQGIADDLGRIAQGHALPALGDGQVCDFCAARGLCRKDFRA